MVSEQLRPAERAARTAEQMSKWAVSETILSETVQSAIDGEGFRESGRTWCSSDAEGSLREPFARYPAAVDLAGCPPGDVIAVWHTHTTPGQLRNPEHSLPDIGNVVFGNVDASIIPGTESDHVLVAAADRERMKQEFRNLLGAEVDTTAEVSEAITSERISAPSRIRDRMNAAFGPLMRRVEVSRPGLRATVDDLLDADTETSTEPICEGHDAMKCDPDTPGGDTVPENTATPLRSAAVFRREARVASHGLKETLDGYDVTDTVVGTTVGMFTSRLLERAVFGE